jgi:hypothetical protein
MILLDGFGLRIEKITVEFIEAPRVQDGTGSAIKPPHMMSLTARIVPMDRVDYLDLTVHAPLSDDIAIALNAAIESAEGALIAKMAEEARRYFSTKIGRRYSAHDVVSRPTPVRQIEQQK